MSSSISKSSSSISSSSSSSFSFDTILSGKTYLKPIDLHKSISSDVKGDCVPSGFCFANALLVSLSIKIPLP